MFDGIKSLYYVCVQEVYKIYLLADLNYNPALHIIDNKYFYIQFVLEIIFGKLFNKIKNLSYRILRDCSIATLSFGGQ